MAIAGAWVLSQEPFARSPDTISPSWTEWPADFVHEVEDSQWPFHGIAALRVGEDVRLFVG